MTDAALSYAHGTTSVPLIGETSVRSSSRMALVSEDFPTFGRPTMAMRMGDWSAGLAS